MSMQMLGKHDKKGRLVQPKYTDGRTKQAFKDETDINKILHRAQKAGTLSHLEQYEGVYGDFADFDFFESQLKLTQGREVFDNLPSELRKEFGQSPAAFFEFVNNPDNAGKLRDKLPDLAKPGKQNIDVSGKTPPDAVGVAREPQATATTTSEVAPSANLPDAS